MKKILITSLLWLTVIANSFSQTLTPTISNIDYVGNNAPRQNLDIYIPTNLTAPAPVIVFIHGGGWYGGGKGAPNVPYFEPSFNAGFICVDINYRVTGDSVWPAQIEDCKTAIRYLKTNATLYNIDTCRFGVIGGSAGGHLSAMVGTSAGVTSLEGLHQGYTNVSSRVQAVVDMFGPTDFSLMDGYYSSSCGTGVLVHDYNSPETHLLNIDSLHNYPSLVQTANPIAYLTPDDANFFIIHGGNDCTVPTYQSVILDSMLTVTGIPADTFIIAAGQGHGGSYYQNIARTTLYRDFFLAHLSTPCTTTRISETNIKHISVSPNPASTHIKINLQTSKYFTVEIVNTFGQTVFTNTTEPANSIDISQLPNGLYFLKVKSGNDFYTQKFIKQ